jgi:uncharacterized protein
VTAYYPEQVPVDGYGAGGFTFARMSHRGNILALPSGIHGWPIDPQNLTVTDFEPVFAEREKIDIILIGTGPGMLRLPKPVREALAQSGIMADTMATGHAISTYNLLFAEKRRVAAALIAVDHGA